jgi:hypothetical protein
MQSFDFGEVFEKLKVVWKTEQPECSEKLDSVEENSDCLRRKPRKSSPEIIVVDAPHWL